MIPPTPTSPPDARPARRRTWARAAFAAYALALVTATHWPGLAVQVAGFSRFDLVVHAGAFGCFTLLFTLAAFFGPALQPRNVALSVLFALCYAPIDEISQGIPVLRRTVDPLDLTADALGIVLMGLALMTLALLRRKAPAAR